jgi:hypothetical protein
MVVGLVVHAAFIYGAVGMPWSQDVEDDLSLWDGVFKEIFGWEGGGTWQ